MWGRDNEESNSQKGMNFASVVTATGSPSTSVGTASAHAKYLEAEPPMQVRTLHRMISVSNIFYYIFSFINIPTFESKKVLLNPLKGQKFVLV